MNRVLILIIFLSIAYSNRVLAGTEQSSARSEPENSVQSADKSAGKLSAKDMGSKLPTVSFIGLDGVRHSLTDWKGKVIMLTFWATWCGSCQIEIPTFVRYQNEYAASGLQIVSIGLDQERKLKNVKRTLGINYPVLVVDPMQSVRIMSQWGNKDGFIPYSVVIDRSGNIKYSHRGQMGHEEFVDMIVPLLTKNSD